ncbi:MAG: hypothetical protein KBT06_03990 [Prevotellaceae bacterium]|nr:hypothetical protein [Candidatus Colivivens equi]
MKRLNMLIFVFVAVCVSSCTTVRKTATTVTVSSTISQYPTIADLDIIPVKKEKTYTWSWNPFKKEPSISVIKGNLIAEILKETEADVMLEPQFIQTKVSYGERSVSVSGYVAKFKDFRKATNEDLKALEVTKGIQPNERTVYNVSKRLFGNLFKKK